MAAVIAGLAAAIAAWAAAIAGSAAVIAAAAAVIAGSAAAVAAMAGAVAASTGPSPGREKRADEDLGRATGAAGNLSNWMQERPGRRNPIARDRALRGCRAGAPEPARWP